MCVLTLLQPAGRAGPPQIFYPLETNLGINFKMTLFILNLLNTDAPVCPAGSCSTPPMHLRTPWGNCWYIPHLRGGRLGHLCTILGSPAPTRAGAQLVLAIPAAGWAACGWTVGANSRMPVVQDPPEDGQSGCSVTKKASPTQCLEAVRLLQGLADSPFAVFRNETMSPALQIISWAIWWGVQLPPSIVLPRIYSF